MLAHALYAETYFVCFLVVLILLIFSLRSESRSASERWLNRVFVTFLCSFAANGLFALFYGGVIPVPFKLQVGYFFKSLFFLAMTAGVFCWCCYAETELKNDLRRNRFIKFLFMLPFLFPVIALALNLGNNWVFTLNDEGHYLRGPGYHAVMIFFSVATLLCCVRHITRSMRESDPIVRSHLRLIVSFPFSIVGAWVFSNIGETIPVICIFMMIELLCLYIGSSQQQISMDKLTQVNNRQNLISFLNYKLETHESRMYLLMIDVDYFKSINDTYGHLEGDKALIRVAEAMKQACQAYKKRPYIARYGGDEFMIILEGTRQEASDLRAGIIEHLKTLQEEAADYELTVSIGLAECCCGMNARDLIQAADEEMYKIKKARAPR